MGGDGVRYPSLDHTPSSPKHNLITLATQPPTPKLNAAPTTRLRRNNVRQPPRPLHGPDRRRPENHSTRRRSHRQAHQRNQARPERVLAAHPTGVGQAARAGESPVAYSRRSSARSKKSPSTSTSSTPSIPKSTAASTTSTAKKWSRTAIPTALGSGRSKLANTSSCFAHSAKATGTSRRCC